MSGEEVPTTRGASQKCGHLERKSASQLRYQCFWNLYCFSRHANTWNACQKNFTEIYSSVSVFSSCRSMDPKQQWPVFANRQFSASVLLHKSFFRLLAHLLSFLFFSFVASFHVSIKSLYQFRSIKNLSEVNVVCTC